MEQGKSKTVECYVIFTKTKLNHWIFRLLDPYFQHCYIVQQDYGLWIILNSTNSITTVRTELVDDYPHIRTLCPGSVILPVTAKVHENNYKWHLGINSCVDVCKGFLGIKNWLIWTPYQLYNYLKGNNYG